MSNKKTVQKGKIPYLGVYRQRNAAPDVYRSLLWNNRHCIYLGSGTMEEMAHLHDAARILIGQRAVNFPTMPATEYFILARRRIMYAYTMKGMRIRAADAPLIGVSDADPLHGGQFRAFVRVAARRVSLGWFPTAEQAGRAYDAAVRVAMSLGLYERIGPPALNFPDESSDPTLTAAVTAIVDPQRYGTAERFSTVRRVHTSYRGVAYLKRNVNYPWMARINRDGKKFTIGSYKTAVEAAEAYDDMVAHLDGPGADLNFPERTPQSAERYVRPRRKRTHATSRYVGVSWYRAKGVWLAVIGHRKRQVTLLYTEDEEQAARAYDAACFLLRGTAPNFGLPVRPSLRALARMAIMQRFGEDVFTVPPAPSSSP